MSWEFQSLGKHCDFQNGFAFKSKLFRESGTPLVRITNIQDEKVNLSDSIYVSQDDYKQDLNRYLVNTGDLLIAMSGATTGKIGFYNYSDQAYLNQRVGIFKPKASLDKRFLFYFLFGKVEENLSISAGSAQPNLSTNQIKNFEIPIPPLSEQKQIVAILDKAFAAIDQAKANIEQNIKNAKELFQSKLNEIFSQQGEGSASSADRWEEKTLGDICQKTANIKWNENSNDEFEYVDLSSVSRESLEVAETTTVNKENAPSRAKKIIQAGDVIFATTRPTLKRATIIDDSLDGHLCSTGYVVLRPNVISPEWIFFYLLTSTFMDRMESLQRGASYPAVTDNDVKGSKLSIPKSKETERKLVIEMTQIRVSSNELINSYNQKINNLEELKKSLLQKAFSGELTSTSSVASENMFNLEDEPLGMVAEEQGEYKKT